MTIPNKKIVFTVTTDLSYDQRMQRICHSLATVGFEVLLLGREKKDSVPLQKERYQQKRLSCWFEKGKLFYVEYTIRLFLFLLWARFDIISSVDLDTLLPCTLIGKLRNKACVFDAHEYFSEVPEVVHRPKVKKVWEWIARKCIPTVSAAYTVSATLQALFSKQHRIPFQLIRNISVETNRITPPTLSASHILLYQGALNEGRGLEALLQVMPKLDNCTLWLVGEGDLSDKLRAKSKELQLEDKVKFFGYVLPKELKLLTPKATIGVNLLENRGLSYYYSLANKTFDYMQAGLPTLHPDFPEYRLLNEQYSIGILVKDLQATNLLPAIQQLTNNKAYYKELQRNCRSASTTLTWQQEENRLINIYTSLDL